MFSFYFVWDELNLILTALLILLVSSLVSRKPYLQHFTAIVIATIVGALGTIIPSFEDTFEDSFHPNVLLALLCPILIIKLIYATDPYMLLKTLWQIILVSTLGFWLLTMVIGLVSEFMVSQTKIGLNDVIMLGVLYQVSDFPEIVRTVEGVKNLELLINFESFLSLVYADTTLEILSGVKNGFLIECYHVICVVLRYTLLSTGFGILLGSIFAYLLRKSYSDHVSATLVLVMGSYFGYTLAEYYIYTSGIITSGWIVFFTSQERSGLSPQVDIAVKTLINQVFVVSHRLIAILICMITTTYIIKYYDNLEVILGIFGYFIEITFRSIFFTILSAIVSRSGYGFNFTSLITLIWRPYRGPVVLLFIYKLYRFNILAHHDTFCYIYVYYILQFTLNKFLQTSTLEKFELGRFVLFHQNNVSNAIKIIQERRDKILAAMKINRFFSGANWTLINKVTALQNPYETEDDNLFENMYSQSSRMTTCPKCSERLHVQPTKAEIIEMSRAARSRSLKAKRILFIQQYGKGYLSKDQVNELLYNVDVALESEELFINVDNICKDIKKSSVFEHLRIFLQKYQVLPRTYVIPRGAFKRFCNQVTQLVPFEIGAFATTVILIFVKAQSISNGVMTTDYIIVEVVIHVFLVTMFFVTVAGYSANSYRDGIRLYFSYSWNGINFLSLIINSVEIYTVLVRYAFGHMEIREGMVALKILACIRVLRIFKYITMIYPRLFARYNRKLDKHALRAYVVAKAIFASYDDIILDLTNITEDKSIKDALKTRLNADRITIMEQIGQLLKMRPWVAGTVETKQSTKCTLKAMKICATELKSSGVIDSYELHKIIIAIDEKFKHIQTYLSIETVPPSKIFAEIPWIYGDDIVYDYLYGHVNNKIWCTGEIICQSGDVSDQIIIIVEGMFKSYYKPGPQYIKALEECGHIPVKELITSPNFLEDQIDFIMIGSFIGELSTLTGREYSSTIVCHLPARALVLTKKVIQEAMKLNPNPVYGLWSRIWKNISFNLVERLLLANSAYEQAKTDLTIYLLENAFVPNLKNFRTLVLCEYITDVVLIDGMLVDFATKEVYKAPCCIPRSVHKYGFLKDQPEVILCIIPLKNADPLDVMFRLERESELVDHIEASLLIANYLIRSRRSRAMYKTKKKAKVSIVVEESPKVCRCKRKSNAAAQKK